MVSAKPFDFPDPNTALTEPNGLLVVGGDLRVETLLKAYQQGIFPWYEEPPILWWCPDPRTVLFFDDFHVSKRLKQQLRQKSYEIRMDSNFAAVVEACAAPRTYTKVKSFETWITPEVQQAYLELHNLGYAHSVEVYLEGQLIGGLYGVSMGRNFFGESMFSHHPNASKIALYYLVYQLRSWGFEWLDCQIWNPHLASLGAREISRAEFLQKVAFNHQFATKLGKWSADQLIK